MAPKKAVRACGEDEASQHELPEIVVVHDEGVFVEYDHEMCPVRLNVVAHSPRRASGIAPRLDVCGPPAAKRIQYSTILGEQSVPHETVPVC